MNNPEAFLENDSHKLLWDFDILISTRRPDLIVINNKKKKRTCKIVDFAVPADHSIKLKEREMKDKYLDLTRELKKNYGIWRWRLYQSLLGAFGTITKGLLKGLEGLEVGGRHPNYSIVENGQNTEKSPRDLWKLAVAHTPVKDYQLTLMWKTLD